MRKSLSVVTTVYRSARTISAFVERALAAAQVATEVELIVVDDGSPDDSAQIVRRLTQRDNRVRLVQLSRNFGHHKAMLTGLQYASGELIFLIDSDLEEAPELLIDMVRTIEINPVDCLYGVQKGERKGGFVERASGRAFYQIFGALSEVQIPENVSTIRLMTRRYVQSLLEFRDKNPVFVPLSLLAGYPQAPFPFVKESTSKTTYSLRRRVSLLFLVITTFSGRPLQLMFIASLLLAGLGSIYGAYVIIRALTGTVQDGWSSLMAVVVFFFSLNAVFTGLIGLYVKQVLDEVKDRPRSVVQETHGFEGASSGERDA